MQKFLVIFTHYCVPVNKQAGQVLNHTALSVVLGGFPSLTQEFETHSEALEIQV